MKKATILFITFALYSNVMGKNYRWWQREELKPSANQIINPNYLSKKRMLEIIWDQKTNALEAFKYFSSKGQNTSAIRGSVTDLEKQIQKLERELKNIPQYLTINEYDKTEIILAKKEGIKITDGIEDLKTFGNKVMFRLDLSDWSTQKLVNFSNVFDTTEGARFFGVRILPQSYILKVFKGLDDINKATNGNISWSNYQIHFEEPKTWPDDDMQRRPEILKMEEVLLKGNPVFIPLLYDGDDVSIRLPKGIYFLNYIVSMKFPARHIRTTRFAYCGKVEKCDVGPYFIKVSGDRQNVVTYSPKPEFLSTDKLNRYFARLEALGVDSLILESLSNIDSNEEKKEDKEKERKTEIIYIRCLSCGKLNPEEAKFCQECGKKLVPNNSEINK